MAYTLIVNEDDLNVLAAGLNELPRKHSQPVFARLQAQVDQQDKERLEAEKAKAKAIEAEAQRLAAEPEKSLGGGAKATVEVMGVPGSNEHVENP